MRHKKPFVCDYPGCSRESGFSSANDLERHRRSMHSDLAGGHGYCCHWDSCPSKDKIWPRADNFRRHLQRIHNVSVVTEDDLKRKYCKQTQLLSLAWLTPRSLADKKS
jgi:hypothetical protein